MKLRKSMVLVTASALGLALVAGAAQAGSSCAKYGKRSHESHAQQDRAAKKSARAGYTRAQAKPQPVALPPVASQSVASEPVPAAQPSQPAVTGAVSGPDKAPAQQSAETTGGGISGEAAARNATVPKTSQTDVDNNSERAI